MSSSLSVLSYFSLACALALLLRKPVELLLAPTISAIMLLSWASGYGVPIYIMRPVLWLVGGVSLAFLAIRKRDQIVTIATPGTVMFLIAIGVVGIFRRDLVLLSCDPLPLGPSRRVSRGGRSICRLRRCVPRGLPFRDGHLACSYRWRLASPPLDPRSIRIEVRRSRFTVRGQSGGTAHTFTCR